MVITVPHKYLYEKKQSLPSRWNGGHKRFYTPSLLLKEVEIALVPNSYRIIKCEDLATNYDYSIPPDKHPNRDACFDILLVLQKIVPPTWTIK